MRLEDSDGTLPYPKDRGVVVDVSHDNDHVGLRLAAEAISCRHNEHDPVFLFTIKLDSWSGSDLSRDSVNAEAVSAVVNEPEAQLVQTGLQHIASSSNVPQHYITSGWDLTLSDRA